MNVAQLIKKLQRFPQDAKVEVVDRSGGTTGFVSVVYSQGAIVFDVSRYDLVVDPDV